MPKKKRQVVMEKRNQIKALQEICGSDNVLTQAEDLLSLAYDATPIIEELPIAGVIPQSVQDVSRILELANDAGFTVVPRGSGTGLSGGSVPDRHCVVMLFPRWDKILEIDTENLTAWVEAGVITSALTNAAAAKGLFYPPDPGSMQICTIGGNVAENSGGLRGLKYGVTANYVMGLEVVLPTGEVITTGNKCVKDVAGLRLKELFIGSEGTLGVFTKVLLKLIPRPKATKTMLATYPGIDKAAETVSAIIAAKIIPCTLEFLDAMTIKCVEDFAHVGLPKDIEALLLIEVDGHPAVVEEEAGQVFAMCKQHGAIDVQLAQNAEQAERLKTARRAAFSALARVRPTTILEDATVPRSQVAPMLRRIQAIAQKYELLFGNFGHAGDGNLHPTCLTDARDKEEMHRVEQAFDEIFEAAIELGGTITGEHGVGLAKKRFFEKITEPPTLQLLQQLKQVMDPNNVLNPGKIFDPKPRCEDPLPR